MHMIAVRFSTGFDYTLHVPVAPVDIPSFYDGDV
jgi:hypothetical protein